ncbi:MAG: response regulator [Planctomycetota bacterium]
MSQPRPRRAPAVTIIGLGAVALLSGLLALGFVTLWTDHLETREQEYFRRQGEIRGGVLAAALRDVMAEFVETYSGSPGRAWVHDFPGYFKKKVLDTRGALPVYLAQEVSIIEPGAASAFPDGVVARVGRSLARYPEPNAGDPDGIRVGVEAEGALIRVGIWGPVEVPEEAPAELRAKGYRFRTYLELSSFRASTDTGRDYALILVLAYWLMLWGVVVFVYLLGRRQEALLFRDQERRARLDAMSRAAEGIAHEIRNPLNGISLNVQFLEKLQERQQPAAPEDFARVQEELTKIRRVIDDFVNFSQLKDIELSDVDLDEAIDATLRELAPMIDDVAATVVRERGEDARLRADHPKLAKVLRCLVRNALEARIPDVPHEIAITVEGDRDRVRCRVENAGRRRRNVPMGYRVPSSPGPPATGLGLTREDDRRGPRRSDLEAHASRRRRRRRRLPELPPVLSRHFFPAEFPPARRSSRRLLGCRRRALRRAPPAPDPNASENADVINARVLIVDDERSQAEGLRRVLAMEGFQATAVDSPRAALEEVAMRCPDAIISDFRMGSMTGLDLYERVREKHPDILFVIVTGFGALDTAVEALKRGVHDFITKPVDTDELVIKLKKALKLRTLESENVRLKERIGRPRGRRASSRTPPRWWRSSPRSTHRRELGDGARHRRERHRQGDGRARAAPLEPARRRTLRQGELRGDPREPPRERAFGHEAGSLHRAAVARRLGKFGGERRHDLPGRDRRDTLLHLQSKFLRVLQEREFERVGGNETIKVDVQAVAATNWNSRRW